MPTTATETVVWPRQRADAAAFAGPVGGRWPVALFCVLLVFLSGYRLLLTQSGQLFWPDEFRYVHALHVLDEIRQGHLGTGVAWLFTVPSVPDANHGAGPAYVALSTVPAVIQGLASLSAGIGPEDPAFYRIPAVANVFVSMAIAIVFFKFVLLFVHDRRLALLSALVYGLLANTNLYVRHLFPYDLALLLLLCGLFLVVSEQGDPARLLRRVVGAGLLAGFGFTTYPGYDPFVVILATAVLCNPAGSWRHLVVMFVSMMSVGLAWEGVARLGGVSLIALTLRHFGTLAGEQGSFEETLIFLPQYLSDVEGLTGAALLALLAVFAVMAIWRRFGRIELGIVGGAMAIYLVFGAAGVFFHRTVYYGRLVHMYLPFVVLAAVLALSKVRRANLRLATAMPLALASVVAFVPVATAELAATFPRDIVRDIAATEGAGPPPCTVMATTPNDLNRVTSECDTILENAGHLYPIPPQTAMPSPPGFTLVRSWKHPLQFRPYWYEGYSIEERATLGAHPLKIKLYRRVP
jgi:hypothetical protein